MTLKAVRVGSRQGGAGRSGAGRSVLAGGVLAGGVLAVARPGVAWAQEAETVRDAASTRVIMGVVIGLVVLGVALGAVTVWFWRVTRPDHPVLLQLEKLGERRVRRRSLAEQPAPAVEPGGAAADARVADPVAGPLGAAAADVSAVTELPPAEVVEVTEATEAAAPAGFAPPGVVAATAEGDAVSGAGDDAESSSSSDQPVR